MADSLAPEVVGSADIGVDLAVSLVLGFAFPLDDVFAGEGVWKDLTACSDLAADTVDSDVLFVFGVDFMLAEVAVAAGKGMVEGLACSP